jgi:hypothetical protein
MAFDDEIESARATRQARRDQRGFAELGELGRRDRFGVSPGP